MTTKKASKAGVRRVTANLDAIASLFQEHHASLGIPQKVAVDFATRCDLLSDSLDRRRTAGYFDPSEIGEEVPGPDVFDSNNPFMEGHFTQEYLRALDEKQMSGQLAANAAKHVADPKLAKLVQEATYKAAMQTFTAMKSASTKKAEEEKPEEKKAEEPSEEEDEKADKTAMEARIYNRIKREMLAFTGKKAEDEKPEEKESAKKSEDEKPEDDKADKSASLFNLFS